MNQSEKSGTSVLQAHGYALFAINVPYGHNEEIILVRSVPIRIAEYANREFEIVQLVGIVGEKPFYLETLASGSGIMIDTISQPVVYFPPESSCTNDN